MTTIAVLSALRDQVDEKIKKIKKTTSANYLALLLDFGITGWIILDMGLSYRTEWFLPATVIVNFINIIAIICNIAAVVRYSGCALKAYFYLNFVWFTVFAIIFLISIFNCKNSRPDRLNWFDCIKTLLCVAILWIFNMVTYVIILREFCAIVTMNVQIRKEFKNYLIEKALTDNLEELHLGNEGQIKIYIDNDLLAADYIVRILVHGVDSLITASDKTISTRGIKGRIAGSSSSS